MTIARHHIGAESFFLVAIPVAFILLLTINKDKYQPKLNIAQNMIIVQVAAEPQSKISTSSQISPDGAKNLTMKVMKNSDGTKTYDFLVSDGNGSDEQLVFSKTLDSSASITIPFNTWSPDNKYFFIEENLNNNKSVYVFKSMGAEFAEGESYIDVTDIFMKKDTGNNFDLATGWASETLIIINTKKQNDTKGPSYWFEVPTKAVIQLSTEF